MWPSIGAWFTYRGSTLRESWLSLSQTNSSSSWGGNSCPALLFLLRFGLTWACSGLLHDVRTTVSSYVQLPCCAQNIVFPCNHLFCLALKLFPSCFFWEASWALEEDDSEYTLHLKLGVLQSFAFAYWAVVGLCVNHHILQIETYLMRVERCINLWL